MKTNRSNILLVSNMWPSPKAPHYGVFVKNTATALIDEGHFVHVESMTKCDGSLSKIRSYLIFYVKSFVECLKHKYDFIYVHYLSHSSLPVLLSAIIKKHHVVANVHGNDLVPESKRDEKMIWFSKRLLAIADTVICPSTYFKEVLKSNFAIPSEKVVVLPSGGVCSSVFNPKDPAYFRKQHGIDQSALVVGLFGRIEKNKGWDIFLEASRQLIDEGYPLTLLVIGNGSEESLFFDKVRRSQLESQLIKLDMAPQSELAFAYSCLDCFVFPTRRQSESLGLVGLEAMACGAIVVGSSLYGPSSYLRNGENGFTFDPFDAGSLAQTIKMVLSLDERKRQEISREAILTSSAYDSTLFSASLSTVFCTLNQDGES